MQVPSTPSAVACSPGYLASRFPHTLDNTIRSTESSWYVRWYVKSTQSTPGVQSVTQVAQQWSSHHRLPAPIKENDSQGDRRQQGREVHRQIEQFLNYVPSDLPDSLQSWWKRRCVERPTWRPLRTEMVVRSDVETRLVGVIDLVLYRPGPRGVLDLALIDWKVSRPSALAMTSGRYQLNLYRHLLEKYYGQYKVDDTWFTSVRVVDMRLIFIDPHTHKVRERDVSIEDVTPVIQCLKRRHQKKQG